MLVTGLALKEMAAKLVTSFMLQDHQRFCYIIYILNSSSPEMLTHFEGARFLFCSVFILSL